jgi:oligoribonuclease
MLLWIDLETTGIDPVHDHILEVAWRITNDSLIPWSVTKSHVARPNKEAWTQLQQSPFVMDMHIDNGLLAEIDADHDLLLLEDIEDLILSDVTIVDETWMVAGSSPQFDLSFIRIHMPRLANKLSHRIYDTTTLKTLFRSVGHVDEIRNDGKHRAAHDINNSLAYAWMYRDILADHLKEN